VEFLRFLLGAMPVATIPAMVTILRTRLLGTRLRDSHRSWDV